MQALSTSLAIIEFDTSGHVLEANANFCDVLGYQLDEIKGQHHRMFVANDLVDTPQYKQFWQKLSSGEFDTGEYKRIAKGGREVWIQASYNPIKSSRGAVKKIVKVAADITMQKLRNAEFESKINAVSRVQAVIEFRPDGTIMTANENFLSTLGYRMDEIEGKHHRMFVDPNFAVSDQYLDFWCKLNAGEFISHEFMRIGKGGKEVWIQASYNPIFDLNGKIVKIVKFATDITERVRAIKIIGESLAKLAHNDLEVRIETNLGSTYEQLREDFNASLDKLQSSMKQIATCTGAIHSGAHEIASATDNLSRRTETQAANLEETAAALNQITVAGKTSVEGAAHARSVVAIADEDARNSASVVESAVLAMDEIAKSSQKISQIIRVIDEIAFQTNLLALNAGVEAARAGDAGRGFAVVASEVRALAQRSAEAAKEIKILISASTTHVDHGVNLVAETGKSLERIRQQVNEINTVVGGIAGGAKDQATSLAEVNTAINQMDQVTQQNASMVEETTAASHSLSEEATQLANLIGQFEIGRKEVVPTAAHSIPQAARPFKAAAKPGPASPRPVVKMVANGASVSDATGWEEF